jgi:hypothetical protein
VHLLKIIIVQQRSPLNKICIKIAGRNFTGNLEGKNLKMVGIDFGVCLLLDSSYLGSVGATTNL